MIDRQARRGGVHLPISNETAGAVHAVGRTVMAHRLATGLFGIAALAALAAVSAAISVAVAAAPAPVPAPASAGDATKGKIVFARCAMCHKADRAIAGGIGPNLAGVYRRMAGRLPGYTYSPAMKASRLTWDDATLSRFLAAPTKTVPGTKMMAAPVANAQDSANLIAYLTMISGGKK
jgi:cytochrome c